MWDARFREYDQKIKTLLAFQTEQKKEARAQLAQENTRAEELVRLLLRCMPGASSTSTSTSAGTSAGVSTS
jgi:hypothetical protein